MNLTNNIPQKHKEHRPWQFVCMMSAVLLAGLGQIATIAAPESGDCLSPELHIQAPDLRQIMTSRRSPENPVMWVQDALRNIIKLLQSGTPEKQQQGLALLFFEFPKSHIQESVFALGRIDNVFNETEFKTAAQYGEIITLQSIYTDDGTLLAQGNPDLLQALVELKIIDPKIANIPGLILSPIRDASPYGYSGDTLHNRSIFSDPSAERSPATGAIVWKGTGTPGMHQTSIPFGIGVRGELNWAWLEGGMLVEEVSLSTRQANLLLAAVERAQALDQNIPNNLFYKPIMSIAPLSLPFKAAGNFSYLKTSMAKNFREIPADTFLVPIDFLQNNLLKGESPGLKKLRSALPELRFFASRAVVPWRVRELWHKVEYLQQISQQSSKEDLFNDIVRRYAIIAAIIHGPMDSVGANDAILTGSLLSSMFSHTNMGYMSFDYDNLRSRQRYLERTLEHEMPNTSTEQIRTMVTLYERYSDKSRLMDHINETPFSANELQRFTNILVAAEKTFKQIRAQELEILQHTIEEVAIDILGYAPGNEKLITEAKQFFKNLYVDYTQLLLQAPTLQSAPAVKKNIPLADLSDVAASI
ncbi:MAG: hypothetical protein V1747_03525 [Candidatus Omnitrophota bacterium]